MDNVESWSRTRRASAHSMGLSSRSNSRSSSAGPSSFTENLTFYMNEGEQMNTQNSRPPSKQRRQEFSLPLSGKLSTTGLQKTPSLESGAIDLSQQPLDSVRMHHNETGNDAKLSKSTPLISRPASALPIADSKFSDLDSIVIEEDTLNLDAIQPPQSESSQHAEQPVSENKNGQAADTFDRPPIIQSLEIDELKSRLTEQAQMLQLTQSQAAEDRQKLLNFEMRIHAREHEHEHKDDLDDQSLIEELEDDLERTRHELDRVIKDKKRMERQLEGTQADLRYERQRNRELEELLAQARTFTSLKKTVQPPEVTVQKEGTASAEMIHDLRSALDRAFLKIESLENKFGEERTTTEEQDKPATATRSEDNGPSAKETHIPVDRAEVYIRKLQDQKRLLKGELRETKTERDEFERRIEEDQDTIHHANEEIQELKARITELEVVKDRMGRVLMYQWGRDEVGQIQRKGHDGKKEQGMGYRYKYYKKDGSARNTGG